MSTAVAPFALGQPVVVALRGLSKRLRAKLEDDDSEPLIINEPRAGYRLHSSANG